jgi:hypothetical protein
MGKTSRTLFTKFWGAFNFADKFQKIYTPGSRIAPSRSKRNDTAHQLRIDAGELVDNRWRNVYLQINSEATSNLLKKWLKSNGSHGVAAQAQIDTQAKDPEAEAERVRDELQAQFEENLK